VHVEQLRDIAVTGVLGKLLVLTLVFDAAPLITACKFEAQGKLVIDHCYGDVES
jgi:hypothetical protein